MHLATRPPGGRHADQKAALRNVDGMIAIWLGCLVAWWLRTTHWAGAHGSTRTFIFRPARSAAKPSSTTWSIGTWVTHPVVS